MNIGLQDADVATLKEVLDETMLSTLTEVAECNVARSDLVAAKATGRVLATCQKLQTQIRADDRLQAAKALEEITDRMNAGGSGEKLKPKKVINISQRMATIKLDGLDKNHWPTQDMVNFFKAHIEKGTVFAFANLKAKPFYPQKTMWSIRTGLEQSDLDAGVREAAAKAGIDAALEKKLVADVQSKASTTCLPAAQHYYLLKKALLAFVVAAEDDAIDDRAMEIIISYEMNLMEIANMYSHKDAAEFDTEMRTHWGETSKSTDFDVNITLMKVNQAALDKFMAAKRHRNDIEERETKRRRAEALNKAEAAGAKGKGPQGKGKFGGKNPKGNPGQFAYEKGDQGYGKTGKQNQGQQLYPGWTQQTAPNQNTGGQNQQQGRQHAGTGPEAKPKP